MSLEQSLYDTLNPLHDAQLKEIINSAEGYLKYGKGEDITRISNTPINGTERITTFVNLLHKSYVARKILQCRKEKKNYTFYDPVPVHPPLKGWDKSFEDLYNGVLIHYGGNIKQRVVNELKNKDVSEAKEYIASLKSRWLTSLAYVEALEFRKSLDKISDNSYLPEWNGTMRVNYSTALQLLYKNTIEINTAIELTLARIKGVEANSNTSPTVPTPAAPKPVTPAATPPVTQVPQVSKNNDEKKGDNSTLYIIAGGAVLLGIIYFVRKKP